MPSRNKRERDDDLEDKQSRKNARKEKKNKEKKKKKKKKSSSDEESSSTRSSSSGSSSEAVEERKPKTHAKAVKVAMQIAMARGPQSDYNPKSSRALVEKAKIKTIKTVESKPFLIFVAFDTNSIGKQISTLTEHGRQHMELETLPVKKKPYDPSKMLQFDKFSMPGEMSSDTVSTWDIHTDTLEIVTAVVRKLLGSYCSVVVSGFHGFKLRLRSNGSAAHRLTAHLKSILGSLELTPGQVQTLSCAQKVLEMLIDGGGESGMLELPFTPIHSKSKKIEKLSGADTFNGSETYLTPEYEEASSLFQRAPNNAILVAFDLGIHLADWIQKGFFFFFLKLFIRLVLLHLKCISISN
jgi:hypothetical protein